MAKRMYYTEAETAAKLGVGLAELSNMVRDNKLHSYVDGIRKMFKVDEVDALAAPAAAGTGEVELTPAEGEVSLSEADAAKPPTKEDTVITAEGISIFDDEDLEIETADPMAKTQIAPSVEEQTALEGVGSGSGLLDLTRESDDTSLGAEVLDHIDMTGEVGSGIAHEAPEATPYIAPQEIVVVESAADTMDASSGLFGGIAVATALLMVLMGIVVGAAVQGTTPGFVLGMKENIGVVLGVAVVVIIIGAVAGYLMGKAVASRQEATRKVGG
ncbi:MAG: hypothetical protein ACE15C_18020 [Phycisphaerae bacterium]